MAKYVKSNKMLLFVLFLRIARQLDKCWEPKKKIYAQTPTPQGKKMSLPKFMFSHLIGHMQILFLKLVVTIFGWN